MIGKGGETIRALSEEYEAQIDVDDDGHGPASTRSTASRATPASRRSAQMTKEVELGDEFTGKVVKTTTFGAFVELSKGTDGLMHISNIIARRAGRDGRGRRQPRRRAQRSRWSRSTRSAAASACGWRTTRTIEGKSAEELASVGTGDKGPAAVATAATAAAATAGDGGGGRGGGPRSRPRPPAATADASTAADER